MSTEVFNPNPTVFAPTKSSRTLPSHLKGNSLWLDDGERTFEEDELNEVEEIDQDEIFELIRSISDPEHRSMSLEQLAVVSAPQISFDPKVPDRLTVEFTPTVPHCGMSTFIGLSIRVRLLRSLPQRYKVDIRVKPGSHQSEHALNKQLNDKERVAAALENPALLEVLEQCLSTAGRNPDTV
ncbi:Cytosolic iron-sulfur assembly component 2B [Taiwanofungus camphoratus]|nr:Cytosolic iron-sulfur assembly component 2B [Antrodia cinnamomea]